MKKRSGAELSYLIELTIFFKENVWAISKRIQEIKFPYVQLDLPRKLTCSLLKSLITFNQTFPFLYLIKKILSGHLLFFYKNFPAEGNVWIKFIRSLASCSKLKIKRCHMYTISQVVAGHRMNQSSFPSTLLWKQCLSRWWGDPGEVRSGLW